jgi:tetratricopeptide (TPR) repeat protein
MPDLPAIFISYAHEDLEAASKITKALLEAGLEVWLDLSELRGGDSWDQRIRGQIKACSLFIPVISEHTNARLEGYFRLEWRLADQRTHLMAKGRPFLVPVVIDNTTDDNAHIPDSFGEVQWTRLPGGETPPAFAERLKDLLGGSPPAAPVPRSFPAPKAPHIESNAGANRRNRMRAALLVLAALAICAAVAMRFRPHQVAAVASDSSPAQVEARSLLSQAWEQLNQPGLGRPELAAADELCRRAAALDPLNADIWAAWSQVDTWYIYHSFEHTQQREENARTRAARAMQLSPDGYESRLAQANYLVRSEGDISVSIYAPEGGRLLDALLTERPNEPRALFAKAILERNLRHPLECKALLLKLAENPDYAPTAWNELGYAEWINGDTAGALEAANRSIALKPFWGNLLLKANVEFYSAVDLDAAQASLEQIPAVILQDDMGVALACELYYFRRDPTAMLQHAQAASRPWLHSNGFDGPLGLWTGLAHAMAGEAEAARLEWSTALDLVDGKLAGDPSSGALLEWKGVLQALLGDSKASLGTLQLAREMHPQDRLRPHLDIRIHAMALNGELREAGELLARTPYYWLPPPRYLQLDPWFDPLRNTPQFKALLDRLQREAAAAKTGSK